MTTHATELLQHLPCIKYYGHQLAPGQGGHPVVGGTDGHGPALDPWQVGGPPAPNRLTQAQPKFG